MSHFVPIKKYQFVTTLSIVCLAAFSTFGCGDDDKDSSCDCATGANCTDEEKASCASKPDQCDCATGTNCSEEEKASCASKPGQCNCATGANCTDEEKLDCEKAPSCIGTDCAANNQPAEIILDLRTPNANTIESKDSYVDYFVKLSKKPTADVTMSITIGNTDEISSETTQLVFTPDNWKEGQKVRFQSVMDGILDADKEVSIQFVCSSSDSAFNDVSKTITIINQNSDAAKLIVKKPKDNVIREGVETDDNAIEVSLGSKPLGVVEVLVTRTSTGGKDPLEYYSDDAITYSYYETCSYQPFAYWLEGVRLVFDQDDWNTPKKVKIRRPDDDYANKSFVQTIVVKTAETSRDCMVDSLSAPMADPNYLYSDEKPGLKVEFDVSVIDNDSKEIMITNTNGGKIITYDNEVVRQVCIAPVDTEMNVSLSVDTPDVKVLTESKKVGSKCEKEDIAHPGVCAYCFEIQGLSDDSLVDDNTNYHITLTPDDSLYEPLVIDAVNKNVDVAGLYIHNANNWTVDEGDSIDMYAELLAKPSAPVKIEITNSHPENLTLDKLEYTIEPDKWQEPVKFKITAPTNEKLFDTRMSGLKVKISSSDAKFTSEAIDGAKQRSISINIVDNAKEDVIFETDGLAKEVAEGERGGYLWIKRHIKKTEKSRITIQSCNRLVLVPDADEFANQIEYQSSNTLQLNTAKTGIYLRVYADDNKYTDGDESCYISVEDSGGEHTLYGTTYVTVKDNEDSKSGYIHLDCTEMYEVGPTQYMQCYASLIGPEPSGAVTVDLSMEKAGGFSFDKQQLVFDSSNKRNRLPFLLSYDPPKDASNNYDQALASNVLHLKSSGSGVYNNYKVDKTISFYAQGQTVYDSRENGSGEITLLPGTYELLVEGALGAGPHQWRTRGGGAYGTFAKGKLKLSQKTKVFVHYGVAGYPRQMELNIDTYLGDNDYKGCPDNYNCGGKGSFAHRLSLYGGDGGGSTDIRLDSDDLEHRVIVAAGGNGAGNNWCDHDKVEEAKEAEKKGETIDWDNLGSIFDGDYADKLAEDAKKEVTQIATAAVGNLINGDPKWCLGDTPTWQVTNDTAASKAENARNFKDSAEFAKYWFNPWDPANGKGGGADGWAGGKVQKPCEGAKGGSGFVWTNGVSVPSSSFKLDKKYQLTDVDGWDTNSTGSRTEKGCLIKKEAEGDAADGIAIIRVVKE
ncbi:MAG: hypothetical protein IJU23_12850 [Proteobacteria bacterium]|nr:hypothetical protein [Pseudomonadota bacterium]